MSAGLRKSSVLVVEDEWLIAQMIAAELKEAGYAIVGPAASLDVALTLIAGGGFDAAVLDVNLNGTQCFPLAEALDAKGVPYLFLTGYIQRDLPAPYRHRPTLPKPMGANALVTGVAALLGE